jgi:hypothetical protein
MIARIFVTVLFTFEDTASRGVQRPAGVAQEKDVGPKCDETITELNALLEVFNGGVWMHEVNAWHEPTCRGGFQYTSLRRLHISVPQLAS